MDAVGRPDDGMSEQEVPQVLLVGSSGGGKATTGDHTSLFDALTTRLAARGMRLLAGQFVVTDNGLDVAQQSG